MATKANTLKGVVTLRGKQNVGKSTEIKHLCLELLNRGATCVYQRQTKNASLKTDRGEANMVLSYKGKLVGIRGAGDSTRIEEDNFAWFEQHQCEFAIVAVRMSGVEERPSAAETAFSAIAARLKFKEKRVLKICRGDDEIEKMITELDNLIAGK